MKDVPQPGEILAGKYVVEEVIGQGGMGCVVAAHHRDLGQPVAIKFLHEEALKEKIAVERFLREARAVVAFKSEHVARVSDVGRMENGAPYMVMERLVGEDLGIVLQRQGRVGVAEAIDFVIQAAEAVAEAHSHGIIHRDLKPSNLFLSRRSDGSALIKLLDFGIAKSMVRTAENAHLTHTGSSLGTPMYMSPEQVRGAREADMRTDIWGLGSTLYELLTGVAPFEADTMPALCAMIVSDQPRPIGALRPEVPAGIIAIVDRCMQKAANDRYQTVSELARAIAPWAPLRCQMILERIVRMLDGPDATVGWAKRDSMSETMALGSVPNAIVKLARTSDGEIGEEETVVAPRAYPPSDTPRTFAETKPPQDPTRGRWRWFAAALLLLTLGAVVWSVSGGNKELTLHSSLPAIEVEVPAEPQPVITAQASATASAPATAPVPKHGPMRARPKPPPGDDLDAIGDRQ